MWDSPGLFGQEQELGNVSTQPVSPVQRAATPCKSVICAVGIHQVECVRKMSAVGAGEEQPGHQLH